MIGVRVSQSIERRPTAASANARRTFFVSVLLACLVSGPLAAVTVFALWANAEPTALLGTASTPAVWSARTFVMAFDVLLVGTWPVAALVALRIRSTSRTHA